MHNLAVIQQELGNLPEALRLATQAYEGRTAILGEAHVDTLASLNALAVTLHALGRTREAVQRLEAVVTRLNEVRGSHDSSRLVALTNLASLYEQGFGDWSQAHTWFQEVYEIRAARLGARHPDTLLSRNNLAVNAHKRGCMQEAARWFEQLVQDFTDVMGATHASTLGSQHNLAEVYFALGRFDDALPLTHAAYHFLRDTLGDAHPYTLIVLKTLGKSLLALGHVNEAHAYLEHARTLYKQRLAEQVVTLSTQGDQAPSVDRTILENLLNLADIYTSLGDVRQLDDLLRTSLDQFVTLFGGQHPETIRVYSTVGAHYVTVGRWAEALPHVKRALWLSTEVLGPDHPLSLTSLANLAVISHRLGYSHEAVPLLRHALALQLHSVGEQHPTTWTMRNNLAEIYRSLGKLHEAQTEHAAVLGAQTTQLSPEHPDRLESLNNRALTEHALGQQAAAAGEHYKAQQHFEAALQSHKQAYDLATRVLSAQHPDTLRYLSNVATDLTDLGRLAEALPHYEEVLMRRRAGLPLPHPSTLVTLVNLAALYHDVQRPADAIALLEEFEKGVEQWRTTGPPIVENRQALFAQWVVGYRLLSRLYSEQGRTAEAFRVAERAKARTLRESIMTRQAHDKAIMSVEGQQPAPVVEAELTNIDQQIGHIAYVSTELARQVEREVRLGKKVELEARQAELKVHQAKLEARKEDLVREYTILSRKMQTTYPQLGAIEHMPLLDSQSGATLVPPDGVLLSFLAGQNRLHIYALTREELISKDLGALPHLEETIATYHAALATPQPGGGVLVAYKADCPQQDAKCPQDLVWERQDGSFTLVPPTPPATARRVVSLEQVSSVLARQLLTPLWDILKTKRHWIIAPDGVLALLPFETLYIDHALVVTRFDVSYVQSLSVLSVLQERAQRYSALYDRKPLLAIGASSPQTFYPSLKLPSVRQGVLLSAASSPGAASRDETDMSQPFVMVAESWQSLPLVAQEINAVASLFPGATVYQQDKATETHLHTLNATGALASYRYILLATHGRFHVNPALSAIVLGQAPPVPGVDGYITASEWMGYTIRSDVVVLSGCDTGRGQRMAGEGVLGLPFALAVAGSTNTVLSLWAVNDASTTQFMTQFFRKLHQGVPPIQALNATKREFLQQRQFFLWPHRYSVPLFWAPFVLYGP
jgi:CHAT domain-containing protein/tetratricopeptide (TPR) repeat protein